MITGNAIYTVFTAVVPLYVAMILAYGAVKWWGILTPAQCAGINRFVSIFAVPLLSFQYISGNNPYEMSVKFILADTFSKLFVLFCLGFWTWWSARGSLEWMITNWVLTTIPNTLVMGTPLLAAMYGAEEGALTVQAVVLQGAVWYTLLLIMYELRAARILITQQFPENAASIVSFRVDSDVTSIDGREAVVTEAEVADDGKLHVTVRRSVSSSSTSHGLSGAEIYSSHSSRNITPRVSSFSQGESHSGRSDMITTIPRFAPPVYIQQKLSEVTGAVRNPVFSPEMPAGRVRGPKSRSVDIHDAKELHMFVWSENASPNLSDGYGGRVIEEVHVMRPDHGLTAGDPGTPVENIATAGGMPPTPVMIKLICVMTFRKLMYNPNTYATLLGLIWSLIAFRWNFEMPGIIYKSYHILSDAGLGMAMFSLGLFMGLGDRIIACGTKLALYGMLLRFLTGPALYAAASYIVGIRGVTLKVCILQAALPQGIVPFVWARDYNVHPEILSTAVIFGMLVALPITLVYYILLEL